MTPKKNAVGGKGPCGSHVAGGGKHEGLVERARPAFPGGPKPVDKVRQLQERLWAVAKRQPERRFTALYDRIYRSDVLWEAWKRVRSNRGSSGIDGETIEAIEQHGVERLIDELHVELRAGKYRPQAVLRRYIPKADGRKRPLGIPTVRDRIVQMACKLVLEPIFEADFRPCSYGYRPGRSATDALETLRKVGARGGNHVLDGDIRDFFGSIDHELLTKRISRRVGDRKVLKLVRQWLEAGVMDDGRLVENVTGTSQGGVISPLLSNIYLAFLDERWERQCAQLGVLVRYADDFVVMCETKANVEEAERRVGIILAKLKLELHPEKTRKLNLTDGKEGFDFLGCHLRKRVSGRLLERGIRRYYLHRWPSARSMKRVRQRVKELTDRRWHGVKDMREIIDRLNPVLRGWGGYFCTGNAAKKLIEVDRYVAWRLKRFLTKRKGRNLRVGEAERWTREHFQGLGLHRLSGHVRYPEAA